MAGTDLQGTGRKKLRRQLTLIILLMALLKFLINLLVWGNYELHREAYLNLVYAQHPAWGYVENPPFIMWMSWIGVKIFGGSSFALRILPALAGGLSMIWVGRLTKELDGKKWAVIIATSAYLVAPVFLRSNSFFLPQAFTEFFWFAYLYIFVKLLQTHNKNYWFILGFIAGLGFLTSYSIFIPMMLTTTFLFATRHRHLLHSPQVSGFLFNFILIASPNLIWQFNHNWPELKNLRELNATQLVNVDSAWFLAMQLVLLAPVIFIWTVGLYNLFAKKGSRPYIVLGYSFLGMILLMLLLHAKPFYPAPFYMILIVFGAIQWENWLENKQTHWLRGLLVVMFTATIPLLPLSLPYLKLDKLENFSKKWQSRGLEAPFVWEDGKVHDIPQDYADLLGWKKLTAEVAKIYQELPTEQQKNCIIYASDYAVAAAFNHLNRRDKATPKAVSLSGSFIFWAPKNVDTVEYAIIIGVPEAFLVEGFTQITEVYTFKDNHARLNGTPVYFATQPNAQLSPNYKDAFKLVWNKYHRKNLE